jgi:predicted nucleotide-binding protein
LSSYKEIIQFGKYEPIISIENETISKPVPDKVLDDMRSCFAGVINVHSEDELLDSQGNKQIKINDNVLIEIGAAMALYGRNYILLVQKGLKLPSNLQGLYRCEYEGEKLDYEATMKLLKIFNQFE